MIKRPSLLDLTSRKAQPASVGAAAREPEARSRSVRGKSYKGILSKVDAATWKQMKRLATELDRPVTELQNLLFRAHGLPEIATKWLPGGD